MPTVVNAPSPPSAPADGDLWFNTTTGREYVWYVGPSGSQWVQTQPSAAAVVTAAQEVQPALPPRGPSSFDVHRTPVMTVSAVPPTGPLVGDLWWDTVSGREFIFYSDVDSSQWVTTQPTGGGGGGSGGGGSLMLRQGVGILLVPEPITAAGIVAIDTAYFDATYLRQDGGSLTGDVHQTNPPADLDDSDLLPTTAWVNRAIGEIPPIDLSPYAPLNSPTFTGDPKAPTPAPGDNDTSIPTTAWVVTKLGAYALNSALSNYLPLAGGSMTGDVTLQNVTVATGKNVVLSSSSGFQITNGIALNWGAAGEISVTAAGQIGFTAGLGVAGLNDAYFVREQAGVISQRNGSSPQGHYLYNTYTDAANWERLIIRWSGNIAQIMQQWTGTGATRLLQIGANSVLTFDETTGVININRVTGSIPTLFQVAGGTSGGLTSPALLHTRLTPTINQSSGAYTILDINPTETAIGAGPNYLLRGRLGAGADVFNVDRTGTVRQGGPLLFLTDNAYDIGQSGANRPRNIYAAGVVYANSLVSTPQVSAPTSPATNLVMQSGNNEVQLINPAGAYLARFSNGGMSPLVNYLTFVASSAGNTVEIEALGSDTNIGLDIFAKGTGAIRLFGSVQAAGSLTFSLDNTYDIGAPGATRPRNIYTSGNVAVGGNISTGNYSVAYGWRIWDGSTIHASMFDTGAVNQVRLGTGAVAAQATLDWSVTNEVRVMNAAGTADATLRALTQPNTANDNSVATTQWVKTNSGGASISVGTSPPASPSAGALWWNSDGSAGGGGLYIYYNDGTSSQWVPATPSVGATTLQNSKQAITGFQSFTGTYSSTAGTAPVNTGGTRILLRSFTPRSSTSTIEIDCDLRLLFGAIDAFTFALFNGSALVDMVMYNPSAANNQKPFRFSTSMPSPGAGVAMSLDLRVGAQSSNAIWLNGTFNGSAQIAQAGMTSWFNIKEIGP